ncbi:MAG: phosphodiester glycosidase family protein [Ferruginibacter sp.]|nr:phosphodiester glycosidase family protein [Bacteroidota bacterium]MBX2918651.1 phosphodiester glycosidase family protein [Ferruginibacter sp.]
MYCNKLNRILLAAGILPAVCFFIPLHAVAQLRWMNVSKDYAPLPASVQVFKTTDSLDGKPFIAFYVKAKLKDKKLDFTADTTLGRRMTPLQFYEKNEKPLVVVNCTFFNFDKNQNLNMVIKEGKIVSYNVHTIALKGKDTLLYKHPLGSVLGIDKKRKADVAWVYADSTARYPYALQQPLAAKKDSSKIFSLQSLSNHALFWKKQTAIGGGPVLVQDGKIKITNEEELKFTGKAIHDKHPRTCMGYTADGYLIILAIQGRFPGVAEGATLEQQAKMLIDIGCVEAMNLDGGGSSCMLVNGKETITPSGKSGERPVPAVFIISKKHSK